MNKYFLNRLRQAFLEGAAQSMADRTSRRTIVISLWYNAFVLLVHAGIMFVSAYAVVASLYGQHVGDIPMFGLGVVALFSVSRFWRRLSALHLNVMVYRIRRVKDRDRTE